MLFKILSWLTSGPLDRVLRTVDNKIKAGVDKEKIKGDIIISYINNKASWLRAGGFWLTIAAGSPFVFHAGAVAVYSVFWHKNGLYPQDWDIAALPPPFDQYQAWIILAWLGVLGLFGRK